MSRVVLPALLASVLGTVSALANPLSISPQANAESPAAAPPQNAVRYAAAPRSELGGGFIEFLFGNGPPVAPPGAYAPVDPYAGRRYEEDQRLDPPGSLFNDRRRAPMAEPARPGMDPKYARQVVAYHGKERAGTIIIDTPGRFLFLVQDDGTAVRYGIGVGRDGFRWAGVKQITRKAEWPDWVPPAEMIKRRPDLPRHMAGGPENPLGARAMYLGSSLYRIHGSNEPWTIGTAVSSGCIRMRNEDVIDLYGRVKVGTKVVVI